VEFGLLGPLVVRAAGSLVPVTAGKQRVLLAALLVRPNQVVATEELAEAVWGDRPPGTARVTLQNYVKRLRHALGPEGYERIVTRPAGYLASAGAAELDVTRFAELAGQGQTAARAGAWEQASAQLSAALSLWRGAPLADVPSPRLAAAEVPRLAEMRLTAAEARIDADLHLGRHQEVIAELASLAASEPLRERLHELLMLALYRSGQQAAALAAYRNARRQLIDLVGIEPGPALRELNQQILHADPALRLPAADATIANPGQPAPSQPAVGQPAAGQPAPSQPAVGQPAAGQPAPSQPAVGQPEAVRPESGPAGTVADTVVAGTVVAGTVVPGTVVAGTVVADTVAEPRPAPAQNATAQNATGQRATGQAVPGQPNGQHVFAAAGEEDHPRPAMLPSAAPGFVGRQAELTALTRLAATRSRSRHPGDPVTIIAISGTAGVGKTALAVHWARQHAADFPDGQLYVNLRGFGPTADPLSPADALHALLDALGTPANRIPATLEGRQALYRTLLAGQQVLILLDNARDPAHARPLLPGSPGAVTVITSRNDLTGLIAADGARPLALDVLAPGEARDVLTCRLGPDRIAAEPDAATELTRLCACLPLALVIIAARAAASPGFPLSGLAAELRDTRHRLDALRTGEDATDTRAVFSCSYHSLDPAVARMFRLLGISPGPDITAAAAASLAGCDVAHARRLLRDLTREHLLTEHTPGRFVLHDLLRAYAAERATADDSAGDLRAATRRILDHYLHTAHAAALMLSTVREHVILGRHDTGVTPEHIADYRQALAWFDAEYQVLAAALALAADNGFDACAWQLQWAMTGFVDQRGHWDASLQRAALAAATRQGDIMGRAVTLRLLARTCTRLGDFDDARVHLTESIALYRQLGDGPGEGRAHQNACVVSERQGRYADALGHAERALSLYSSAGDLSGRAAGLNDVGWYHALLGDHQPARAFCEESLILFRELGDRYGQARTLDSLGFIEHQLGNSAIAANLYSEALGMLREVGSRFYEAEVLTHLGDAREAMGEPRQAGDAWRQALGILDDLGHSDAEQVRDRLWRVGMARGAELAQLRGN
jgi:DNA-binding SARP family transcriptional activator